MGLLRRCFTAGAIALALVACGQSNDTASTEDSAQPTVTSTEVPQSRTGDADSAAVTVTDVGGESTDAATTASDTTTAADATATTVASATTSTTTPSSTTSTSTTSTSTTSSTTTSAPADTTTDATIPFPDESGALDLDQPILGLGRSVQDRPIIAERYGTPGGRRVLVVGVIHGNEDDGVPIIELLRTSAVPDGVELWLVESMNPDGQAAQDRHNANEVDLNRNFPHDWGPIGQPGDGQYAGTGPASEPETQAMVNFITQLRPDIAIWYHQDANLIIPSTGRDGAIRQRYAELTDLPLAQCCGTGGIYTGIAATWARRTLDSVAFIVELPGAVPPPMVEQHANAVLTILAEGL